MRSSSRSLTLLLLCGLVAAATDYSSDQCYSNSEFFYSSTTVIASQPATNVSTVLFATTFQTQGMEVDCLHVWRSASGSQDTTTFAACVSTPPAIYVCYSTQDIFRGSGGVQSSTRPVTFNTVSQQVGGRCYDATYDYDASSGNIKATHVYTDGSYKTGSTDGAKYYWWIEYRPVALSQCYALQINFASLINTDLEDTSPSQVTTIIIVCVVGVFVVAMVVVAYVCFRTEAYRKLLGLKPSARSGPPPPPAFSTASLSPPRGGQPQQVGGSGRHFSVSQSPYDYGGPKDIFSPVNRGHPVSLLDEGESDYSPPSSIDSVLYAGQGPSDRAGPLILIQGGSSSPASARPNQHHYGNDEPHTAIMSLGSPSSHSSPSRTAAKGSGMMPYALPTPPSALRRRDSGSNRRVAFAAPPNRSPPASAHDNSRPLPATPSTASNTSRGAATSAGEGSPQNGAFALFTPTTAGKQVGRGYDLGAPVLLDGTPLQPTPVSSGWMNFLHDGNDGTSGGFAAAVPWGPSSNPSMSPPDDRAPLAALDDDDGRMREVSWTIGGSAPRTRNIPRMATNPQFEEMTTFDTVTMSSPSYRPRYIDPQDDSLL